MDFATLGKTPIDGDNPAGRDVRYDPQFEVLQGEIDKLSSPTASGQVDWGKIVDEAAKLLSESAKDLTVASYLAVALVHTRKIEGMDQGLQILGDMLETYWDQLYPPKKRMRGRSGAITWWTERMESELQGIERGPLPSEQAERMRANLKRIDEILVEKMPDPPLMRPIQRILERFPVQASEKAPAPPVEPELAAQAGQPVDQPADPTAQRAAEKRVTAESAPAGFDLA